MSSNTSETLDRAFVWRTSSASNGDGECVEVTLANGRILVRDSKNRLPGQILSFALPGWQTLVAGI